MGRLLKQFANRPSDMCARYGGEEFVLVWGDTRLDQALDLVNELLQKLTALKIPNINSATAPFLTASIGLAEMYPDKNPDESEIITRADNMLYKAKEYGRNRVEY